MAKTNPHHTLRMFLDEERPTAVKVMNTATGGGRYEWLPRSLISYARKLAPEKPGERQSYVFTLPEWKIEEAALWDFVTS